MAEPASSPCLDTLWEMPFPFDGDVEEAGEGANSAEEAEELPSSTLPTGWPHAIFCPAVAPSPSLLLPLVLLFRGLLTVVRASGLFFWGHDEEGGSTNHEIWTAAPPSSAILAHPKHSPSYLPLPHKHVK